MADARAPRLKDQDRYRPRRALTWNRALRRIQDALLEGAVANSKCERYYDVITVPARWKSGGIAIALDAAEKGKPYAPRSRWAA